MNVVQWCEHGFRARGSPGTDLSAGASAQLSVWAETVHRASGECALTSPER